MVKYLKTCVKFFATSKVPTYLIILIGAPAGDIISTGNFIRNFIFILLWWGHYQKKSNYQKGHLNVKIGYYLIRCSWNMLLVLQSTGYNALFSQLFSTTHCGFGISYLQTCFLFQTSANIDCCRHLVSSSSESSNLPKKCPAYRISCNSPGGRHCAADVVVVVSACGCGGLHHHISEHQHQLAGNSNFRFAYLCAGGDHQHQKLREDQYQIQHQQQQENHRPVPVAAVVTNQVPESWVILGFGSFSMEKLVQY